MSTAKDLETALDAFRHYLQGTQQSLDTLNDASGAHDQRLGELMSTLDALRQDVQAAQTATAILETTLRSASSAAREQQDAQARQWADLDTRFQAQGDELRQRLDMLSERQDQAQIQQDTLQGALAALNDRVGSNEQRLTAHSEQFSKFENVLREVHGEVMTLHQRLQALEDATRNPAFEEQAQRLAALEEAADDAKLLQDLERAGLNHLRFRGQRRTFTSVDDADAEPMLNQRARKEHPSRTGAHDQDIRS